MRQCVWSVSVCHLLKLKEFCSLHLSLVTFAKDDRSRVRESSTSNNHHRIASHTLISTIDLDVSMDFEPDDNDSSFDDENFNPNQKVSKKVASGGGGKVAVNVAVAKSKTTKPPAAHQKTIEQTYQKKTQLEVRRPPPLLFLVDKFSSSLPCLTRHSSISQ